MTHFPPIRALVTAAMIGIATFGIAAFGIDSHVSAQVLAGIDVLQRDEFKQLAGRDVGLITNHTGTNFRGVSTVKLLRDASDVNLAALFSPEHGFAGLLDQATVDDALDTQTGLKIFSLYGKTRTPTPEMLTDIDTLVFDIQDIGTRFYTYISTMKGSMKVAAEQGIRFVVLDRPNPIDGVHVQGPISDADNESFVSCHSLPVRHGMTIGELASMFKAELNLDLDLVIIPIEGWKRKQMFDSTGRLWINPSPNMRSLNEAILYPGIGLLETTNLSVGRGTDTPFERVGAPWIDAIALANAMNGQDLPGIRFMPIRFTPTSSKYADEICEGIDLSIVDRDSFQPVRVGLALAVTLRKLYPDDWDTGSLNRLLTNVETRDGILGGQTVDQLLGAYQNDLRRFEIRRQRYLIYP